MGLCDFVLGMVVGVVIVIFALVGVLSHANPQIATQTFGTPKENNQLISTVADLQQKGYNLTEMSMPVGKNYTPEWNLTAFLDSYKLHNVDLHWTLIGTLGPKLWFEYDGIQVYWRSD